MTGYHSDSLVEGSATLPVQEGSCFTWRSNFYTVPMSAFSINKRKIRDQIHQDYLVPLSDHGSYGHTAQMSSSISDSCGNPGSCFYTNPISAFSSNKSEKTAGDQMQQDCLTPPSNHAYRATMVQTSSSLSGTLPVQGDSCLTSIFDFHTDAVSAFSSNKRQSKVGGQGYLTPPYYHGHVAAVAQVSSSLPGPKKYQSIASPSFSIQPNFSPADGINQVQQGLYYSPGQYRSPVEMSSCFHSHQQTPGAWSAPNDKSSCSAVSNSPRSVNFPCPGFVPVGGSPPFSSVRGRGHLFSSRPSPVSGHEGSSSYNSRRGRGVSSMSRGSGRGCGRGLGPRAKVSAWDHPELFRKKSMEEDPWKFLKPVVGDIASLAAGTIPDSRRSWLPKSVIMEKLQISEATYESSSKQSLAEYLAAAFNEAVDDPCTS